MGTLLLVISWDMLDFRGAAWSSTIYETSGTARLREGSYDIAGINSGQVNSHLRHSSPDLLSLSLVST